MTIWKNNNKLDELKFAADILFGLAISKRFNGPTRREKSFSHEFQVNQDGLQDRDLPRETKEEFKLKVMRVFSKNLTLTPQPFTGKLIVHVHDNKVAEVHFIPKPDVIAAE